LAQEAEALGVDSVWLAGDHFSAISVLSSPITIASALAAPTQRIRIGLAVVLLPLAHPIPLAQGLAPPGHTTPSRGEGRRGGGSFTGYARRLHLSVRQERGAIRRVPGDRRKGVDAGGFLLLGQVLSV